MGQFRNYPAKPFNANQNFLARDPSGSGDVIRVNAQGILDAAVAELQKLGGEVLGIDTKTEVLATDLFTGVYVVTGGDVALFDGGEGIYRVSDPGTGGDVMANGNELVLIINVAQITSSIATNTAAISTNKQSYTATFSSNTYTVTPEISPTAWPTLQDGLIIEFNLPSSTVNTASVNVDLNGTILNLMWGNGAEFATGELNSDYTIRIRGVVNGSDLLCLSEVSGEVWSVSPNGRMIVTGDVNETVSVTTANSAGGFLGSGVAITFPKSFSQIPIVSFIGGSDCGSVTNSANSFSQCQPRYFTISSTASLNTKSDYIAVGRAFNL